MCSHAHGEDLMLNRGYLARLCLAGAFGLLPVGPIVAQDEGRVWAGHGSKDGAALNYGMPDSDDLPLAFYCPAGSDEIIVSYVFEPIIAEDGVIGDVTLRAGDIEVTIEMIGSRMELDDQFVLSGRTVLDARLADLITSRGTLEVIAETEIETFDLEGAHDEARFLLDACGRF